MDLRVSRSLTACVVALIAFASGLRAVTADVPKSASPEAAISNDGRIRLPDYAELVPGFSGFAGTEANGQESIIGADNRSQITPTTSYPARAIGAITHDGYPWCSGWLISRDTVLTAGHCVHSGGASGTWYTGLRFIPGQDGVSAPYGSCEPRQGGLTSFMGWIRNHDENYDAGIIKLSCTVGDRVGWFGLWWQAENLNGNYARVQGYPADKPATQWQSFGLVEYTTTNQIFYQNDTFGGMSGSPVWRNRASSEPWCQGVCGMAVHTYGLHGTPPHSTDNHATRNTQAKFNIYRAIAVAA